MNKLIRIAAAAVCMSVAGVALGKLPPPSDEAKAKAEDAKTKAADAAKKDAELLAKAQDRVAERTIKEQKAKGVILKPTPVVVAAAPAAPAAAAPAKPAPDAAKK